MASAATERAGPALLALVGLLGSACGGSNTAPARRQGPPGGALVYQQIDGTTYSVRLLLQGGGDQALPGRAAANAYLPSFSLAAGGQMAFRGLEGGHGVLVLHAWVDDAERVLDVGALDPYAPAISPDGLTVAFEGVAGSGPAHLFLVPTAGGTPAALAAATGKDAGPVWSPDGLSLFFTSTRSGQWEIHRINADGTGLIQITTGSKLVGRPAVSPDGQMVAYARTGVSPSSVVVLHSLADGTERVLSNDAAEADPDFDVSGQHVVTTSTLYGAPCLALRDATTGALVSRLTDRPGLQSAPAFAR